MDTIYTIQGRPFRRDGEHLWARDGRYVGRFRNGMVFSPSGSYLGEFHNDRLGYKTSNGAKRQGSHMSRMNRMGSSASTRMAMSMPSGWQEFRG